MSFFSTLTNTNISNYVKVLEEFKNEKNIFIEDSVIENYVSKELEKDSVKNIAVFGFKDNLRLIAELENLVNAEVIMELSFEKIIWETSHHELVFRYKILEVYPTNLQTKLLKGIPAIISNLLIPFSGFVTNQVMDSLTKKFSEETLLNKLNFEAVSIESDLVKINIDKLIDLNNIVYKTLVTLVKIEEIKIDKKGIHLFTSLTNKAQELKNLVETSFLKKLPERDSKE